jgi:hypothetical protein
MEEIWKDIPSYEGLYQASNLGNIKSLRYNIILKPGKDKGSFLWFKNEGFERQIFLKRAEIERFNVKLLA